jgi:hypothetical protein
LEQAIREQEEAERAAKEAAKEAARKLAEEEAAREAAKKARGDAEARKITVPIRPTFAPDELLAEVVIPHGATVDMLAAATHSQGRLPFQPRLRLGSQILSQGFHKLIDMGVNDGEPVLAELSAVLTTSKDKTAIVWDALTGECLYFMKGHEAAVCSGCASPDLKYFATCSEDQTAKFWVAQRESQIVSCLFTLRGHEKAVNSVAFSPDGKWIATASSDCTARIWSVKTGECKRAYEGHRGEVFAATFMPDGTRLKTKARDATVKIWEIETGRCCSTGPLDVQSEAVASSAADGHIRVEGDGGTAVTVHDVDGGSTRTLDGHTKEVLSVTFIDVRVPTRSLEALNASRNRQTPKGSLSKTKSFGGTRPNGLCRTGPMKTR